MADVEIVIDGAKVKQAIANAETLDDKLLIAVNEIAAKANALGAGYRTGKYHPNHKSPGVGGTQPKYAGDVQRFRGGPVGIVHPKNYAAMKDNHLHNTMLKAL